MTITAASYSPRPITDNLALSYNRQKQIAEQNAQTGSQLDLKKEVNASIATTIAGIFA
ncbi:MAG: hypothetical protein K2Q12_09075 [Rickettsiales bacterium]|nr:hypothetical protein [Rickettsiales bacterium]